MAKAPGTQRKEPIAMTPVERMEAFRKAWADHKRAGFANTQEEANKLAKLYFVTAPPIASKPEPKSKASKK